MSRSKIDSSLNYRIFGNWIQRLSRLVNLLSIDLNNVLLLGQSYLGRFGWCCGTCLPPHSPAELLTSQQPNDSENNFGRRRQVEPETPAQRCQPRVPKWPQVPKPAWRQVPANRANQKPSQTSVDYQADRPGNFARACNAGGGDALRVSGRHASACYYYYYYYYY
jgi:hypothetical protein